METGNRYKLQNRPTPGKIGLKDSYFVRYQKLLMFVKSETVVIFD